VNIWKRLIFAQTLIVLMMAFVACAGGGPTSDQIQAQQAEADRAEAVGSVGPPAITKWTEMRFAKQLYELRDNPTLTYVYMKNIDGSFTCIGEALGYGLPYGVQYSNPEKVIMNNSYGYGTLPQAEPNGLFMPDTAEATWVQMKDPNTGGVAVAYFEERLTILPYQIPCVQPHS
jgi:hypothetical protein